MSTISVSTTSTTAFKVTPDTAGTLVLQTGSSPTTAMTIDGSQNVGIGVTPSAWGAGFVAAQVSASGAAVASRPAVSESYLTSNCYFNGTDWIYKNTATAAYYAQYLGTHKWNIAASGTAGNPITFTQAMTLDASGNLGIGTSSPSYKLDVLGGRVQIRPNSENYAIFMGYNSSTEGVWMGSPAANVQAFYNNAGTERARIDSSGNLLVGATALTQNASYMGFSPANGFADFGHINGSVSGLEYLKFLYNGSKIGSITQNGTTAVAYNTSSDYRLKHDIAPMTGALARVAALKPVTYKWNADESEGEGFIAHELAEVCPHAVTGDKDAVDADGNPVYQGIDTSFLVATLTAAIQELSKKNDALELRLAALEAK